MRSPQEIRALAQLRLDDAGVLAENGRSDGAFYLAGYAVELTLKARLTEHLGLPGLFDPTAKKVPEEQFKDVDKLRQLAQTHNLLLLLSLCGIKPAYHLQMRARKTFLKYQPLLESWNEGVRYQLPGSATSIDAQSFLRFLQGPDGFLQWIESN